MEVRSAKFDADTYASTVSQAAFNGSSEFFQCHLSTFVKIQLIGDVIFCKGVFQCFESMDIQSLFDLKHSLGTESCTSIVTQL